jgi:putative hydrolase of the HAD superfamily
LGRLQPIEPIPTGTLADCRPLDGIGGVVFDIYGTLLVSASGDVEVTEFSEAAVRESLDELSLRAGEERRVPGVLREVIKRHHAQSPHPHPEVDILAVWADVLSELTKRDAARPTTDPDLRRVALAFETANNPVFPMPGMAAVLRRLRERGLALGIVSNAQFFTPITMAFFLEAQGLQWPFSEDLTVYSYWTGRAKPDRYLFDLLAPALTRRRLVPSQVIYVGNDMLNDVYAAGSAGLRTVLFAGDRRSLRLRERSPELAGVKPERTIVELSQLLTIIGEDPNGNGDLSGGKQ